MKRMQGYVLSELAIVIAIVSLLTAISVLSTYRILSNIYISKLQKDYLEHVFNAMDLNFYENLSSNGRCFSLAPTSTTIPDLVTLRLLESKYALSDWFVPADIVLTYTTNSETGWADGFSVQFPLPNPKLKSGFRNSQYFYGETDTYLEFRKGMDYDFDDEFIMHMDSNFCEE